MSDDGYVRWYSEKLWRLLPAVYRTLDPARPGVDDGPLRELIGRIGEQTAVVRRSIDRLWEDQSIETCDDWVIPYIGQLLATRMVSCLDARGQRLDVARTIYYRRRSGTLGLLEELAADIAGRDARTVEFFRRLGRTRHQFDPPIGPVTRRDPAAPPGPAVVEGLVGAFTRTPAGGYADLRDVYGAANAAGPFDEFAHTADFRRGRQTTGWHNIPKLGVFIWWLRSFAIKGATPVERAGCPGQFTFDPSGRETPLFAPATRARSDFGEHWVTPDEWRLPTPVRRTLWAVAVDKLYPNAFSVGLGTGDDPDVLDPAQLDIDPEAGRFRFLGAPPAGPVGVAYHFGFSAEIGAGGHDPRILPDPLVAPAAQALVSGGTGLEAAVAAIAGDATVTVTDSSTYPGLAGDLTIAAGATVVLAAADGERPVVRWTLANASWRVVGGAGASLAIQGFYLQGGDIVLTGDFDAVRLRLSTFDPGTSGAGETPPTVFASALDGLALRPATLIVEGTIRNLTIERCICGPIRTRGGGAVETLTIDDSLVQSIPTHAAGGEATLYDPAELATRAKLGADPAAAALRAALNAAATAQLNAYAPGSQPPAGLTTALKSAVAGLDPAQMAAAFPLALADLALGFGSGSVALRRTTVMGPTHTHRLSASECILDGIATVEDPQHGCVRFSTHVQGSNLHSPYRSVFVGLDAPLFRTRLFGRPDYARLRDDADLTILGPVAVAGAPAPSVVTGAEDGAEPGAFCLERVALKRRGLAQKYEEFMPISLTPVWIDAD